MNSARIAYSQRPDATSEAEAGALASIYRFILDCHAKEEAAPESRPEDVKGRSENDFHASNHSNP